jgi:predicted GIY-YIG superfamily endonuclease
MGHWIYVLECEDDYIYIGETRRLYRRFTEHLTSRGGSNTNKHKPYKLIGLYKVNENHSFMKYRNTIKSGQYNRFILDDWEEDADNYLLIENRITERFLYERRENDCYGGGLEWYKVRGGKYTRETLEEIVDRYKGASEKEGREYMSRNPIESIPVDTIVDRPLCKCNYPSEVKLSKDKSNIYFVCALKNVWGDFFSDLEINKSCNFWELYTDDREIKHNYEIVKAMSKEKWILNLPLTVYKNNPESCISCGNSDYIGIFNNGVRRVCQTCIVKNYSSLKEEYENKCMIVDI